MIVNYCTLLDVYPVKVKYEIYPQRIRRIMGIRWGIIPLSTILHPLRTLSLCSTTALGTSPTHPHGQNSRSLSSSTLLWREYSSHVGMEVESKKVALSLDQGSSIHPDSNTSATHPFPLSLRETQHPTIGLCYPLMPTWFACRLERKRQSGPHLNVLRIARWFDVLKHPKFDKPRKKTPRREICHPLRMRMSKLLAISCRMRGECGSLWTD